jgi:hypothetical protein
MGITEKLKDEKLLHYLSMNLEVRKFVQTDGEALLLAIKEYIGHIDAGRMAEAESYVEDCNNGKSLLMNVQCSIPNEEGRGYAMQLYKLREFMGHTPAFTSKWIKDNIIGVHGGVSDEYDVEDRRLNNV